jgi:hypothetical protein
MPVQTISAEDRNKYDFEKYGFYAFTNNYL